MMRSVAQKIGLLIRSFGVFGDRNVLRCFNSYILPCLEYCSPVWSSAADSHLKLLDGSLRACKFLTPNFAVSLLHHLSISFLYMLYKIFHNPLNPLHSELPNLFYTAKGVMKGALSVTILFFSSMRFNNSQYSRYFI